jgi:alkanesulfonate monooxygenase SsuD/methylene tetrahydromethanopterin reductase-like flavin-dependent oxidoreductase (luciferase family)
LILPGGTATEQLELAELAEATGWEGVFVWEAAFGIDAWTLLAATLLLRMRWDDRPRGCR